MCFDWLTDYANLTLCLCSCSQTRCTNSFLSSSMCWSIEPDVSTRKIHDFSTTVPNTRLLPEVQQFNSHYLLALLVFSIYSLTNVVFIGVNAAGSQGSGPPNN